MKSIGGFQQKQALVLERIVFYGVLASILLAAVPNGTVDLWNKSLFILLICAFAIIRVFENLLAGNFKISEPLLLAPMGGVIILGILQLIPTYFESELKSIPYIKSIATADQYETRKFLINFTALLLTGEILFRYTKTRSRLLVLLYLVITVGLGSALFGLTQQIFPISANALLESIIGQNASYAQFINRNHFAFLMEMTLGLLAGLILRAELTPKLKLLCWLMVGIISIAAITANSRGGILSLMGLGLFAVFLHFSARNRYGDIDAFEDFEETPAIIRLKALFVPAAACFIFAGVATFTVAFIGGDPVASRIESIQREVQENEDSKIQRTEIWNSTIKLIKENPATGVGLGAYGFAITRYDDLSGKRSLQQAHNDYLEILANGGIVAFLLFVIFLVLVVLRIRRELFSRSRLRKASCFGAVTGIVGVMLHSFVDFGLHTTINALIFIVLIVISTARIQNIESSQQASL